MQIRRPMVILTLLALAAMFPVFVRSEPLPGGAVLWRAFASAHPAPLFYRASGIAVGGGGNVFIADSGDHRVEKLSSTGKTLTVWGTDIPGPLRFSGPWDVAADAEGHIYLADGAVLKLSSSGRVLARWTGGALDVASRIAADRVGTVYALSLHPVPYSNTNDTLTITRISADGRRTIFRVFRYPQPAGDALVSAAIAVAPSGDVVLSIHGLVHCHDCDGTYYQVWNLSPTGKMISRWRASTGGMGLAVEENGTVLLTAPGKVEAFTPDGTALASWGESGCGILQFGSELRLAAGPGNRLFVADSQVAAVEPDHLVLPLRAGVLHVLSFNGEPVALAGRCPADHTALFGQISGLAVAPGGPVYAADEGAGRVVGLGATGTPIDTLSAMHPTFVATDARGNLYVPDLPRQILEKHSPAGVLLAKASPVDFEDAVLDLAGNVYGITGSGMVQVLGPMVPSSKPSGLVTLPVIRGWQLKGYARSQGGLNPSGITRDSWGNIYVADTRFNRIQKFSASGVLLGVWGKTGSNPGEFRRPSGITVDGRGHLYVLDAGNDRVQELDFSGRVLAVLGRHGQALGQFDHPAGIAADAQGDIYVGDNGNDRIQELVLTP